MHRYILCATAQSISWKNQQWEKASEMNIKGYNEENQDATNLTACGTFHKPGSWDAEAGGYMQEVVFNKENNFLLVVSAKRNKISWKCKKQQLKCSDVNNSKHFSKV